jgi:membrane protease subunit HflC
MSRRAWIVVLLAAGALLVVLNTFYIVRQTDQVLVRQFGRAVRTVNAGPQGASGLYAKIPFVEDVVRLDKRNLGVLVEGRDPIVAADQQRLVVDAFARYRITNPLVFYQKLQSASGAQERLAIILNGALRRVLASASSNDIVSGQRAALLQRITANMQSEAKDLGVQVLDVRIRQADLPQEVADKVYERMRTEREQVAAKIEAEGREKAAAIQAGAAREAQIIRATGQEEADRLRGEGDAERARIYAKSFGRDPEFAAFYRSLQAYENALQEGTPVVITPDSEFFRYLRNKDAR